MKFPWFGTKARAPRLARWSAGIWSSGEPPQGYEAQVRAAYLSNPVAQRAVRLVAESAASAPLTGETAALRLLGRPNPGQTGAEFIEGLATALLLNGNGYVTGDAVALHLLIRSGRSRCNATASPVTYPLPFSSMAVASPSMNSGPV